MTSIKPRLIAFDSFSTRSMATFVDITTSKKTERIKIFIDPGIAIAPLRYGLEPTRQEWMALRQGRKTIMKLVKGCDIVTISHYHFDHHPSYDDLAFNRAVYKHKIVLAKHWKQHINHSQKQRATVFKQIAEKLATHLEWADNKSFNLDDLGVNACSGCSDCVIRFSKPVWHGRKNSRLGFVVMTIIEASNKKILHASDIQGPITRETTNIIIKENPDFIIIGGPPTYFLGWRLSHKDLDKSIKNVIRIMQSTKAKTIIIDHHLTRDKHYYERFKKAFSYADHLDVNLTTAARFNGIDDLLLEARRNDYYKTTKHQKIKQIKVKNNQK